MNDRYILYVHTPVPCSDLIKWAEWFGLTNRIVKQDTIGDVFVSTVFLALDHPFGSGLLILFETMIFGGHFNEWRERCSTWDEAEKMHKKAVSLVKLSTKEDNHD